MVALLSSPASCVKKAGKKVLINNKANGVVQNLREEWQA